MITIMSGLPRSGKSYLAVWWIYNHFINSKSPIYPKHKYIITNIGGFKHDHVNEILEKNPVLIDDKLREAFPILPTDEYVLIKQSLYLDWNKFYEHLKKLYEMGLADKSDEDMIRYCKYHNIAPALLVIDESYRYFTAKLDPVLKWFLGYHGHLGYDVILIIHRPSLMHRDYSGYTEEFIDAQPKSRSFTNNIFRYFYYGEPSYTKHYDTKRLTASQDIFSLYKSGDLHKPKKIIYKYVGIMVLAVLFLFSIIKFFYYRMEERIHPNGETAPVSTVSSDGSSSLPPPPALAGKSVLRIRCDAEFCARIDPAFEHHFIPRAFFEEIIKMADYKMLSVSNFYFMSNTFNDYVYLVNTDVIKYFPSWNIPIMTHDRTSAISSISANPIDSGVTPK